MNYVGKVMLPLPMPQKIQMRLLKQLNLSIFLTRVLSVGYIQFTEETTRI